MSESEITHEVRALFAEDAKGFLAQMESASALLLESPALTPKAVESLKTARPFVTLDDAAQSVRGSASSVDAEFLAESSALVEQLARRGAVALELLASHAKRAHAIATFCAEATREMRAMLHLYVDDAAEEAAWLAMDLRDRGAEALKLDDEAVERIEELRQREGSSRIADEVRAAPRSGERSTVRPPEGAAGDAELSFDAEASASVVSADDDEIASVEDGETPTFTFDELPHSEPLAQVFQAEAREIMLALKGHVEAYLNTGAVHSLDPIDPLLNTLAGSAASVELPYLSAWAAEASSVLSELRRARVGNVASRFVAAINRLLSTVAIQEIDVRSKAVSAEPSDVADVFVVELQRTIEAATSIAEQLAVRPSEVETKRLGNEASKLFHRLKGTSLVVGATMIADEASALMAACKNLVDAVGLSVALREGVDHLVHLLPQAAAASAASFDDPLPPVQRARGSIRPASEHPNFISAGLLAIFREEVQGLLPEITENLTRLSGSPRDPSALEALHRLFHTLKGTAAAVEQVAMSAAASILEEKLELAIEDSSRATAELAAELRAGARLVFESVGLASSLDEVGFEALELSSDDLVDVPASESEPVIVGELPPVLNAETEGELSFDEDKVEELAAALSEFVPAPPEPSAPSSEGSTSPAMTPDEWDQYVARCQASVSKLGGKDGSAVEGNEELDAIFNEEVEQLEPTIAEAFSQLLDVPSDLSMVRVLERVLHTLKGSAATVERKELSAVAEMLRAAFEAVSESSGVPLDTTRVLALQSAVVRLLDAATNRASRDASGGSPGNESPAEFAFDEGQPDARPDDELLKIFLQEARESLIALQGHVETLLTTPQSVYAAEYIERLFHTLKGAAATVGLSDIAKQAAELQSKMEELLTEKRSPTPQFMEALLENTNKLLVGIGVAPLSFNRTTDSGHSERGMISSLQNSSDDVERKIFSGEVKSICRQASAKARELLGSSDATAQVQLRRELADLFHRLKGTAATVNANMIAREAERATELCRGKLPVRDLVDAVRATIVRIADLAGFERIQSRGKVNHAVARETVVVPEDKELWEAFEQECVEIIDGLEKSVLSLEEVAQPKQVIEDIFRLTHTLKGAVNTVGLSPTGKLLHVTEDFLDVLGKAPIMPPMRTVSSVLVEVLKDVRQNLRTARSGWVETSLASITAMIDTAIRPSSSRRVDVPEMSASLTTGGMVSLFDSAALFGTMGVRADKSANGSHPSVRSANSNNSNNSSDESANAEERSYIRVATSRLDALMNLAGELVVSRSRLSSRVGTLRFLYGELGRSRVRLSSTVETFREQYEYANLGGKETRRARAAVPASTAETTGAPARAAVAPEVFGELELDEYEDIHVLSRSLAEIGNDFEEAFRTLSSELSNFEGDADSLGGIITGIQGEVTRARMVPLDAVFARLRFPVRDAALRETKEVTVTTEGAAVNIDKTIADAILQPMLHLVRNAVVHGIEAPSRRALANKPPVGTIRLSARQESGQIVIEVADDGAGLDLAALRARGIAQGFIGQDVAVDDPRVKDLVFAAGLSTKAIAGDVAGRGVGGDVVKRSIERLNGAIRVETRPGKGTVFEITLPLTLAITRALLVQDGASTYAVPLYFAERILDAEALGSTEKKGDHRILIDGMYHRVHALSEHLEGGVGAPRGPALVLRVGDDRLVLRVDAVLGQEEVVVKKAGELLEGHPLFAGVTLRGTGDLVLILDVPGVLSEAGARTTDDVAGPTRALPKSELHESRRESTPDRADPEVGGEQEKPKAKGGKSAKGSRAEGKREPAKATEATPKVDRTALSGPLGGVRALVVDDSLSVRKVAEAHLRSLGVAVTVAVDGLDGLTKLREGHFDIVFTDLEMPRMHGYDFIRQMRLLAVYQALPVVVVSSRSGQKHQDHARSVGATDYLTKPFSAQSLESTIRKWLRR